MTGDLILRYEEIVAEQGGAPDSFHTLEGGMLAMVRRMQRSLDPDEAARTETRDAISDLKTRAEKVAVIRGVKRALPRCESPIEKILMPWLIAQRFRGFRYSPRVLFSGEGALLADKCVAVVPQLPLGRYRTDFALATRSGPHVKFVIVECDGRDFHDSDHQKQRDAERDAYLRSRRDVLDVIRFPGAAIYRSPANCASEAAALHFECWRRDRSELDFKFTVAA